LPVLLFEIEKDANSLHAVMEVFGKRMIKRILGQFFHTDYES